ncbi:DUF4352 domain-containing protein [Bacillus thuringiensis]|nr:DUF4352 domain-containing protein [Bacillus thuringiensis]
MKKTTTSVTVIILCIFLCVGCAIKPKQQSETRKMKQNKYFEITPNNISPYAERDRMEVKPPKDVVKVDMIVKNKSNTERGIGSLEFKAFDAEGKELSHYGYADSIGDVVGIGDTLEGSVFWVAKKTNIAKIKYIDPDTQEEIIWNIKK